MTLTKLIIAALVLLGLGGLVVWVNKHPQDKTPAVAASPKLIDVPEAQIQSVELTKSGDPPIVVAKDKSKWAITAPVAYPADQDTSVSMIASLSGVTADSVVEDTPRDLAQYGLKQPAITVAAHKKSGKTDTLYFGDDIPASSQVYARVNNDPKIYAVSSSLKSSFNKGLNDLRDKRLLTFDPTQVSRVELIAPKSTIEFGKVNQTEWQIVKPEPARADSFQVEDILRKLADAKMDLGAQSNPKADESAFNAGHAIATAKITDASGIQSLDVRQTKDAYYARSNSVPTASKVPNDLGQLLAKPLNDFRNKKIFDFGFSDTNSLELHQASGDKLYTRSGTDWKSGSQTVDAGSLQGLVDKLRDLTASAFLTTGFNAPDIAITVVSNDNKRTEKVELSKTATGYVARREGQPALYQLDAKSVSDILEAATSIKAMALGAKK